MLSCLTKRKGTQTPHQVHPCLSHCPTGSESLRALNLMEFHHMAKMCNITEAKCVRHDGDVAHSHDGAGWLCGGRGGGCFHASHLARHGGAVHARLLLPCVVLKNVMSRSTHPTFAAGPRVLSHLTLIPCSSPPTLRRIPPRRRARTTTTIRCAGASWFRVYGAACVRARACICMRMQACRQAGVGCTGRACCLCQFEP